MNSKHLVLIALVCMIAAIPLASAYAADDGYRNKYVPINITADVQNNIQINGGTLTVFALGGGSIRDNVIFIHNLADPAPKPLDMTYYMDGNGGEPAFNQTDYLQIAVLPDGHSLPVSLKPGAYSWTLRKGNGDQPEFGSLSIVPGRDTAVVIHGDAPGRARTEVWIA
jgi:hypothetical protein